MKKATAWQKGIVYTWWRTRTPNNEELSTQSKGEGPTSKVGKEFEYFIKEDTRIASKHMKKMLNITSHVENAN